MSFERLIAEDIGLINTSSAVVNAVFAAVLDGDQHSASLHEEMYVQGVGITRDVAYLAQLGDIVTPVKNDGRINEESLGIASV